MRSSLFETEYVTTIGAAISYGETIAFETCGVEFAFSNRKCFFLIDHGQSQDDEDVPIMI